MTEEKEKTQPESMENILKSIKNIISGESDQESEMSTAAAANNNNDEDILELTERVDEPSAETTQPAPPVEVPPSTQPEPVNQVPKADEPGKKDVLMDIDEALKAFDSKQDVPTPPSKSEPESVMPEPEPIKTEPKPLENLEPVPTSAAEITELPKAETQPKKESSFDNTPKNIQLLSEQAAASTKQSFQALMESFPKPNIESPSLRSGSNLEDIVVEALKPMMAEWLNQNLPLIVKQIVEREVKKLIPKD